MIAFLAALAGAAGVAWGFWPIVRPLPPSAFETWLERDLPGLPPENPPEVGDTLAELGMVTGVPGEVFGVSGDVFGESGAPYRVVVRDGVRYRVYLDAMHTVVCVVGLGEVERRTG